MSKRRKHPSHTDEGPKEYLPPSNKIISAFAQKACEMLAVSTRDERFTQRYVVRGLTNFLEIAARAQAKWLNGEQNVDNEEN
jgi:hypothetical protein